MTSTGPFSTSWPRYITTTSSVISAITPMSWVIRITASPRSCCSLRISSRICACVVTSSAVVGSSAIRMRGSAASASAIITRWRSPPDSSNEYASTRCAGRGMPTIASSSIARARAARFDSVECRRIASMS